MSHEITKTDHMVSVGQTPWHGLGIVLPDGVTTSAEIAEIAFRRRDGRGGAWEVELHEVQTASGLPVPSVRAVVRDDTREVLGDVGAGYSPLANAEVFRAFDPLVDAGILRYETAGSLRGGAKVWVCASIAIRPIEVAPGDRVTIHALLSNGHTRQAGSIRVTGCATRVVCANTLAAALAERLAARIVHRGDVASKARDAVATIDEVQAAADLYAERLRALTRSAADDLDVARYLSAVWRKSQSEIVGGRTQDGTIAPPMARAVRVLDAFDAGDGPATEGTWWGVYQALTREITHGSPSSKKGAAERAESNAWGSGAEVLARAEIVAEILARRDARLTADVLASMATGQIRDVADSMAAAA